MMKKNILLLLLVMVALVSCEKDIFNESNKQMTIEQFSPEWVNGAMKLSGRINLPAEFNRETAKVGFYVAEYNKNMSEYGDYILSEGDVFAAYRYHIIGNVDDGFYYEDLNEFHWVDEIKSDGTFEISFVTQIKQYICIAFAVNFLESDVYELNFNAQLLQSKPFFFTGEASVQLEQINSVLNQFRLTFTPDEEIRNVGLCWSSTNPLPHLEDDRMEGYVNYGSNVVDFDRIDFGDQNVVYVRGYIQKTIEQDGNYWNDEGEAYKVIYSNVLEIRPKEIALIINTKEEFQSFINSLYVCTDTINNSYDYRGDDWWRSFKGRMQINYAVEKVDWLDKERLEYNGDSTYLSIPELNGTIEGKGVIPEIYTVNKSGVVKGMSVLYCRANSGLMENVQNVTLDENNGEIKGANQLTLSTNYGLLQNVQNVSLDENNGEIKEGNQLTTYTNNGQIEGGNQITITNNQGTANDLNNVTINSNYSSLTNSKSIYVYSNYGLVQKCTDVLGTVTEDGSTTSRNYLVFSNRQNGKMIDCNIETQNADNTYMICYYNYGYMENCLPNSSCCEFNYGVIKNPYSEDDYADENVKEYPAQMFYGTWECDSIKEQDIVNGEIEYEYTNEDEKRLYFQEDGTYIQYWYRSYDSIWYVDKQGTWEYKDNKLIITINFDGYHTSEYKVSELTDSKLVTVVTQYTNTGHRLTETVYHKVQ